MFHEDDGKATWEKNDDALCLQEALPSSRSEASRLLANFLSYGKL